MTPSNAADAYASAERLFLDGDLELARQELQDALSADDNAGQLWELLGSILYTLGKDQEATHALEQAVLLVPLSNCSQFVLAMCYEQQDKDPKAILNYLVTRENLDDQLLEPLARALGRNGECKTALKVCCEASRRMPDAIEPLMGMVFYMRRMKRPPEEVLPVLFRAHHLDPDDTDCRITLAWVLHECQRSMEAAYLLSLLPIEEFRCFNCLSGMHTIFQAAGDADNAIRCLKTQERLLEEHE